MGGQNCDEGGQRLIRSCGVARLLQGFNNSFKGLKFDDISEMLLGAKSKFLQEVCNPFKEIAELAGLNDKKLNCSKKMMCLTILS